MFYWSSKRWRANLSPHCSFERRRNGFKVGWLYFKCWKLNIWLERTYIPTHFIKCNSNFHVFVRSKEKWKSHGYFEVFEMLSTCLVFITPFQTLKSFYRISRLLLRTLLFIQPNSQFCLKMLRVMIGFQLLKVVQLWSSKYSSLGVSLRKVSPRDPSFLDCSSWQEQVPTLKTFKIAPQFI